MCSGNTIRGCDCRPARSFARSSAQPRVKISHNPHRNGSHSRCRRHTPANSSSGSVRGHIRRHDRIQGNENDTRQKPNGARTLARHRSPCPRHIGSYRHRRQPLRSLGITGAHRQRTLHSPPHPSDTPHFRLLN